MVELLENAEEILETLWINTEEEKASFVPAGELANGKVMEQLLEAGFVTNINGEVKLTEKGKPEAENIVRRHRLAERLLTDVLGAHESLMHEKACRFEHLLDRGLDENICILLGHPRVCPHGKPIPPGKCCQGKETQTHMVVAPLSRMAAGESGKVAYIYAPESGKLQKLMAMGILPGAVIKLIQTSPSFVFQAGQTQFAVDREIAEAIYLRLTNLGVGKSDYRTSEGKRGFFYRKRQRLGS